MNRILQQQSRESERSVMQVVLKLKILFKCSLLDPESEVLRQEDERNSSLVSQIPGRENRRRIFDPSDGVYRCIACNWEVRVSNCP